MNKVILFQKISEKKVADYFLKDVENVFNKPIAQLAQDVAILISMSGKTAEITSDSTYRFVQNLR